MSENLTNNVEKKPSERFKRVMDERHRLVDRIIENMRQGYIMPKPLWDTSQYQIHNPVSGAHYKGGNYIKLLITSEEKGYQDPRWLTYEQAKKMKWRIKKGAKGTHLEKYTSVFDTKEVNEETGETEIVTVKLDKPIITHFTVFNAEQIEGIPPLSPKQENVNTDTLKLADQLIASSACPVMELTQSKAFYSPGNDRITLPPRNTFISSEAFATVLMHEMIHSTGHESRLNRPILNKFGTPEYAKEELRAELGSYFMGTDVGIVESQEILASHTQYLESWIKVLQNDPNELFRACSDAQKAVEMLERNLERQQEMEKTQVRAEENLPAEHEAEQQREPADIDTKEQIMPEETDRLLNSIELKGFGENQYMHFLIDAQDGSRLQGAYRLLADENGPENTIVGIENADRHPELYDIADELRDRLSELTGFPELKRTHMKLYPEKYTEAEQPEESVQNMPAEQDIVSEPAGDIIQYSEPVVKIIYSSMNHPMLAEGNQLTFAAANELFGSLNQQREREVYMSDHITDPLAYPTEYSITYQDAGNVVSVRDTYTIGAEGGDLLEHIFQSHKSVHEAYVHVNMHVMLDKRQQEISLNVKDLKERIENLKLSQSLVHNPADDKELEAVQNDMQYQRELMQNIKDVKNALAVGDQLPAVPIRKYSLDEYLMEKRLYFPVSDYTLDKSKLPNGLSRAQEQKMMEGLMKEEMSYHQARQEAIKEFHNKVKRGEIIEKTPNEKTMDIAQGHPDLESTQAARRMLVKRGVFTEEELAEKVQDWDKNITGKSSSLKMDTIDTIKQQTEEYVTQMQVIEEAMVMEG